MTNPTRIQRSRAKDWRMPEGAVYVGRPTKWGNPYQVRPYAGVWMVDNVETTPHTPIRQHVTKSAALAHAVQLFETSLTPYQHHGPRSGMADFLLSMATIESIQRELRGRDLVCWCPIGSPCHADVLLRLANGPLICDEVTT